MNGEMLDELRRIASGENPIPQKQANRLLIAAMVGVVEEFTNLRKDLVDSRKIVADALKVEQEINRAEHQEIKNALAGVNLNPAIILGAWVKQHPKAAAAAFLVLFVLLNMWFVSDFRGPLLEAVGFPSPLVTAIP